MKTCTKCGKSKPLSEFTRYRKDGGACHKGGIGASHRPACKVCNRSTHRKWWNRVGGTARDRAYNARNGGIPRSRILFQAHIKQHGLSLDEFAWLLYAGGFACHNPGCCKPIDLDGIPGSWGVDHDHSHCPGVRGCAQCIRGILCRGCNTALGQLGDNGDKIVGLLEYLGLAPSLGGTKRTGASGKSGAEPAGIRALKPRVH